MRAVRSVVIGLAILLVPSMAMARALKLDVKGAEAGDHLGQPAVYVELTQYSAVAYLEFTKMNINKMVVFRLDGGGIQNVAIREQKLGVGALFS